MRQLNIMRFWRELISIVAVVALSLFSVVVVISNAGDEPYAVFRHSDAMVQIGGAYVLLVLWLEYALWIIVEIIRQKISMWWWVVLIWVATVSLYVSHCPFAYVEDITKFVIEPH
ncbi:MAG: hypothetical protein ABUL66_01020 [Verrucomicrobiota bacterium]